jgi:hypothetical protein
MSSDLGQQHKPREFTNRNASCFEKFPLWLHDRVLKEKQLLLELQISKKQKDEVKLTMDHCHFDYIKKFSKKKGYYLNSNETPNP